MSLADESPHVLESREGGILTLTLNRPEQLNAFTVTMADEL
jgi:enoyl-CoA hydratase/carnithine racemase